MILSLKASRWNHRDCTPEKFTGKEPIGRSHEDSETLHPDAVWRFTKANERGFFDPPAIKPLSIPCLA